MSNVDLQARDSGGVADPNDRADVEAVGRSESGKRLLPVENFYARPGKPAWCWEDIPLWVPSAALPGRTQASFGG
jgi:hypothetical protein